MSQSTNVWTLPSAAQTLSDIRNDLSEGISLCLVLATPGDVFEFEQALHHELESRGGLVVYSIHLTAFDEINAVSLRRAIKGDNFEGISLDHLILDDSTPDVIVIKGFDKLSPILQKDTLSLMHRWANYCHTTSAKKSLCLIVSGDHAENVQEIQSNITRLKTKVVIGIPSSIEMQLINRAQHGDDFISAENHWQEVLISSLTGNDLDMAYFLWQSSLNSHEDITKTLIEYAQLNCWDRSGIERQLKDWVPLARGTKPEIPRHLKNFKLMCQLTTVYTPEYGEEIHPAGLVLLGKLDELKHRIWRSQAMLALPIIDELRIKIYLLLKNKLIPTWDLQDVPEIGPLKFSLERLPAKSIERQRFYPIVCHAREVRNKLAHIDVITLRDYKILWNDWKEIRQMVIPTGPI